MLRPEPLLTVEEAEAITRLRLRHHIANDVDGFASQCVVRLGRAVRIRPDALRQWIESRTGAPPFRMSAQWREKNRRNAGRKPARKAASRGRR